MQTVGYWMEKGVNPEYLLTRTRDEMVIFAAIARLNKEETEKQLGKKG